VMKKFLTAAFLIIMQTSFANATGVRQIDTHALIISPKVFVLSKHKQLKHLEILIAGASDGIVASLKWTDNAGDRSATIEIVNISFSQDKSSLVFQTKQWLPYTLSGEVVSLPVILKNAQLKLL